MIRKDPEAFLRKYLSLQFRLEPLTETLSSRPAMIADQSAMIAELEKIRRLARTSLAAALFSSSV